MIDKLTHLHISEMLPFYVKRNGFDEGHTSFRAEPLAVAPPRENSKSLRSTPYWFIFINENGLIVNRLYL